MKENPVLTLVAPSRALVVPETSAAVDTARLGRIRNALTGLGWSVREADNTRKIFERFAGSDAERTEALEKALTDTTADLALALRGGYGAGRILPRLNWERLTGKTVPLAGFSDVTALFLAFLAKVGKGAWLCPCASSFDTENCERDAAFSLAFRSRAFSLRTEGLADRGAGNPASFFAEGLLWGGNLSVCVSLLGTPYFPAIKDGILFLEDIAEPAYRIERALLQLLYAGILEKQKALVLGDFTGADAGAGHGDGRFGFSEAVDFLRQTLKIPVLTGFPIGHIPACVTIPTGVHGSVSLENGVWTVRSDVTSILPEHAPGRN